MILAKTNARTKAENRTRAIQALEGVETAPVCSDKYYNGDTYCTLKVIVKIIKMSFEAYKSIKLGPEITPAGNVHTRWCHWHVHV